MKTKPREGVDFGTFQPGNRQSGWNWYCQHCVSELGRGWRWNRVDARNEARDHFAAIHGATDSGSSS